MLRELLRQLIAAETFGTASLAVVSQLDANVYQPTWLSDFRNAINYSIDTSPRDGNLWQSELRTLNDTADLESRLVYGTGLRDEQRIELVMLSCLALLRSLYTEYLARAARPDRRAATWRESLLADLPDAIRGPLLGSCANVLA